MKNSTRITPLHTAIKMAAKKEVEEFLSEVLSQTGEHQLPYPKKDKLLIKEQLISLTQVYYPSLSLKIDEYSLTHTNLLCAYGNIPMVYQSLTYQAPVEIWFTELFPRYAPHVHVCPMPDTVIVQKHPFMNPDGFVCIEYLLKWDFRVSNLVDLCEKLSEAFGLHPPLYSTLRPDPNSFVNPHLKTKTRVESNLGPNSNFGTASVRAGGGGGRVSPNLSSESLFFSKEVTMAVAGMVDKVDISLRNSITNVVKSLCGEFDEKQKQYLVEYESLCWKREGQELGERLKMVLLRADHLRDLVSKNGPSLTMGSVQNVISGKVYELSEQTLDVLSKKIVECTAFDVALDDVVATCKGLYKKRAISCEVYLKIVRLFSRLQFQKRATSFLVHDTLRTMESRASR